MKLILSLLKRVKALFLLYYVWIAASFLFSLYGVVLLWPWTHYTPGNEFILFTDFATMFQFLPAIYILSFSLTLQVISRFVRNKQTFYLISMLLYSVIMIILMLFTDFWSIPVRVIAILIASSVGLIHLFISVVLNKNIRLQIM